VNRKKGKGERLKKEARRFLPKRREKKGLSHQARIEKKEEGFGKIRRGKEGDRSKKKNKDGGIPGGQQKEEGRSVLQKKKRRETIRAKFALREEKKGRKTRNKKKKQKKRKKEERRSSLIFQKGGKKTITSNRKRTGGGQEGKKGGNTPFGILGKKIDLKKECCHAQGRKEGQTKGGEGKVIRSGSKKKDFTPANREKKKGVEGCGGEGGPAQPAEEGVWPGHNGKGYRTTEGEREPASLFRPGTEKGGGKKGLPLV